MSGQRFLARVRFDSPNGAVGGQTVRGFFALSDGAIEFTPLDSERCKLQGVTR